jgi:hypothetical protein
VTVAISIVLWIADVGVSQVFAPDPGATIGEVSAGDGQALYGTFGRDAAATGGAYSNYRKYHESAIEIQEAVNDAGNASSMTWSGLNQSNATQAPGMFIGKTRSTVSYADHLINLGTLLDLGEGANPNDSRGRRDWDTQFGFLEDPAGFVQSRMPNTERWDLWDGNWGSDGVSFHLEIGANIDGDPATENTDFYVYPGDGNVDHVFNLQSGDSATAIADQSGRDIYEFTVRRIQSAEVLDPAGRHAAGVNYDDRLEVSWKMELNDPTNADPVLAREVKMSAKAGNLIYEKVFDPGAPGSPIEPNPEGDPGTNYKDGYFDWRTATPVMFIGAQNGTVAGGQGTHGVFLPGDFTGNGTTDVNDLLVWELHRGKPSTTYSRGDFDQNGQTDITDARGWASGATPAAINGALSTVSASLRQTLVRDILRTWFGDANLDGQFNSSDLVQTFQAGKYEVDTDADWSQGDWNGDRRFGSSDLVVAFQDGGYEQGPRPVEAATVPEPAGASFVLVAIGLVGARCRKRPAGG